MKKLLITLTLAAFVVVAKADSNPYTVNDAQIESVMHAAQTVSLADMSQTANLAMAGNTAANGAAVSDVDGKNFTAAILLNFFLGYLGIHRLYLGTKTLTWVGYILTCGGIFGIVPLVDFIVLIINNQDISPYVNNPKFFMWANG